MYCSKCGTKNEENAKFCASCGAELASTSNDENQAVKPSVENPKQNNVNDSVFRKALKRDAKGKPKGALAGMFGLQFVIPIILFLLFLLALGGFATADGDIDTLAMVAFSGGFILLIIVYFIFAMLISFGMMKASLVISRSESVTFGSVFKGIFKNFSSIMKAIGGMLLYSIILGVLALIPFIGGIAALVLQVYFLPVMVVFIYMMLDAKCEEKTFGTVFSKSMELVKGHRVEFYGLMLSFIGWMILAVCTLGILYFWLMPYMMITMANWYRSLNGEVSYDEGQSGISNVAIIILSIVGYFVFIFALVFTIVFILIGTGVDDSKLKDDFDNHNYSDIFDDYNDIRENGSVVSMSGINVYIPNDYKETTMANYEKIYMSPNGQIYVGTNTQNYAGSTESFIQALRDQYNNRGFSCEPNEIENINGASWNNFSCDYNDGTEIDLYIAHQNNKLHYLIFTDASDSEEADELLDKIEDNLSLAR